MILKFETIVQIFRKIIQLNSVIILKSTNEYYWKIFSKCGRKMDLYPALNGRLSCFVLPKDITVWQQWVSNPRSTDLDFYALAIRPLRSGVTKKVDTCSKVG